jgi:hypothetical protein
MIHTERPTTHFACHVNIFLSSFFPFSHEKIVSYREKANVIILFCLRRKTNFSREKVFIQTNFFNKKRFNYKNFRFFDYLKVFKNFLIACRVTLYQNFIIKVLIFMLPIFNKITSIISNSSYMSLIVIEL